jgi:SAM-dependent methyltransferase
MSRWRQSVTRTAGDAKRFWESAELDTLLQMMEPTWAWRAWLKVAAGNITEPGSVFEPGCGIGMLADLLPEGCRYYGCDINPVYIEEALRRRAGRNARFEVRDLEDVLASGEIFDWVVVTSLFGMFPEETAYELMPRFWDVCRRGLSITTIDKAQLPKRSPPGFEFSAHDAERLLKTARSLPEADHVELHRGREFPELRGRHWSRSLVLYVRRKVPTA